MSSPRPTDGTRPPLPPSPRERQALELSETGLTGVQIAAVMGISYYTLKITLAHGREKLRDRAMA